jgi:hypothetical protein
MVNPALTSAERDVLLADAAPALVVDDPKLLRQLLSAAEPESVSEQRWALFRARLQELIEERLNLRRVGVRKLVIGSFSKTTCCKIQLPSLDV